MKQRHRLNQQYEYKRKADSFLSNVRPSIAELLEHSNQPPDTQRRKLQKDLTQSRRARVVVMVIF
jgi:hypothetical protein